MCVQPELSHPLRPLGAGKAPTLGWLLAHSHNAVCGFQVRAATISDAKLEGLIAAHRGEARELQGGRGRLHVHLGLYLG